MNFIRLSAIILTLSISSDVVNSTKIKFGQMTRHSHPMLASLFNVANGIRRLNNRREHNVNRHGIPNNEDRINRPLIDHGIRKQHDIVNIGTKIIPVKDKRTAHSIKGGSKSRLFPSLDKRIIKNRDIPQLAEFQSGSGATPNMPPQSAKLMSGSRKFPVTGVIGNIRDDDQMAGVSIVSLSADMMCSLCQQQGNATCIAIHCWKDQTSGIVSESQPLPLFPESARSQIPILPDNFDFRRQIDRHDLLQLTTQNLASNKNMAQGSRDMSRANLPVQTPQSTVRESTAPIWLLSDNVRVSGPTSSTPNWESPRWSMTDGVNLVPDTLTDKTVTLSVAGSQEAAHGVPPFDKLPSNVQHQSQDITFIDGNLHPLVSDTIPSPGGRGQSVSDSSTHTFNGEIYKPLEVSTNILRQLIRIESQSGTPDTTPNQNNPMNAENINTGHAPSFVRLGNSNDNGVNSVVTNSNRPTSVANDVFANINNEGQGHISNFPDGFIEGSESIHGTDKNLISSLPQIPTASDVFSDARNVKDVNNRHTLVIKNHGATEVVGVHIGNGPILRSNIRPLEASGQNQVPQPANNQLIHSRTLTDSVDGHSHHGSHDHQSPIVGNNDKPGMLMNGVQQELGHMDNVGNSVTDAHSFSTTTPIPTINPARRAVLNNWSKELLRGTNF